MTDIIQEILTDLNIAPMWHHPNGKTLRPVRFTISGHNVPEAVAAIDGQLKRATEQLVEEFVQANKIYYVSSSNPTWFQQEPMGSPDPYVHITRQTIEDDAMLMIVVSMVVTDKPMKFEGTSSPEETARLEESIKEVREAYAKKRG